eukprot:m51a1_g11100 putative lim-type zinc finger-containing protein (234) ;mRNA; r:48124-49136
MPTAKCAICGKSAYPLESVTAVEQTYHKSCFKCETCHLQLTLTNFKGLEGKVYCTKHVPQATATAVVDSVALKQATSAPKRTAEGLGAVQKGTGEKPKVGLDTVQTQTAMHAPKRAAEGLGAVQKGTGEKPQVGLDTVQTKTAMSAPKRTAEGLGTVQKGSGGKPTIAVFGAEGEHTSPRGEQQQQYEEQPQEQQYQEEQPQEQAQEQQYQEEQPQEQAPEEQQQQAADGSSW